MSSRALDAAWMLLAAGCAVESPAAGDTAEACTTEIHWEDLGEALLIEHCQSCHAADAPERFGAPEAVVFDSRDDVAEWREAMLAVLTVDPPTMPPALSMAEDDLDLLVGWLECGDWDG